MSFTQSISLVSTVYAYHCIHVFSFTMLTMTYVYYFSSGTGSLLVRTVHMLQSLRSTYPDLTLLVPGILCKLLHEHLSHDDTTSLAADAHISCWSYEDPPVQGGGGGGGGGGGMEGNSGRRSIAYNGKFLYLTNTSLNRLLKIGTGRHGTLR